MERTIFYKKKTGPKSRRPSKEILFDWRKTHSVDDCAKHFNVSRMTIYRWTNYYLSIEEMPNNAD